MGQFCRERSCTKFAAQSQWKYVFKKDRCTCACARAHSVTCNRPASILDSTQDQSHFLPVVLPKMTPVSIPTLTAVVPVLIWTIASGFPPFLLLSNLSLPASSPTMAPVPALWLQEPSWASDNSKSPAMLLYLCFCIFAHGSSLPGEQDQPSHVHLFHLLFKNLSQTLLLPVPPATQPITPSPTQPLPLLGAISLPLLC